MTDETRRTSRTWLSPGKLTVLGVLMCVSAVAVSYLLPIYWEHRAILAVKPRGQMHFRIGNRKPEWIWKHAPEDWQVLTYLDVESTSIDDTDLYVISEFRELEYLDISGAQISDDGLSSLRNLTQLRELYLYDTPISDAGLKHLASLTNLEGLNLAETRVTLSGVADLRRQLPGCKIFW